MSNTTGITLTAILAAANIAVWGGFIRWSRAKSARTKSRKTVSPSRRAIVARDKWLKANPHFMRNMTAPWRDL